MAKVVEGGVSGAADASALAGWSDPTTSGVVCAQPITNKDAANPETLFMSESGCRGELPAARQGEPAERAATSAALTTTASGRARTGFS
jgi:hypothetical protein